MDYAIYTSDPSSPTLDPTNANDLEAIEAAAGAAAAAPRLRFPTSTSILKLATVVAVGAAGAWASVAPRDAPREQYVALFQRNFALLGTSLIGPGIHTYIWKYLLE